MKIKFKEHRFEEYKTIFGTNDIQLELIDILHQKDVITVTHSLDDSSWVTDIVYSITRDGIQKISIPLVEQKYFYVMEV